MNILNSLRGTLRSSRWHIGALLLAATLAASPAQGEGEGGQASWYVIDTSLVNGVQLGYIQKFVGGQSVNEPYRQGTFVDFVGIASFNFPSPAQGTLTLPNGAMEIARYDIIGNGVASGPAAGAPRGG